VVGAKGGAREGVAFRGGEGVEGDRVEAEAGEGGGGKDRRQPA
jgi:hypothetical protein